MITHLDPSNICLVKEGVIVHGCNAQGVMGSGVAKQLRAKYPDIFPSYVRHLDITTDRGFSPLGTNCFVVTQKLCIVNAITQEFYGRDGKQYVSYEALSECLWEIADCYGSEVPIHIPYLIGAGLGGGDADTIMGIIEKELKVCDVYMHHWK